MRYSLSSAPSTDPTRPLLCAQRAAGPEDVDPDLPDYPKLLVLWAGQSKKQKPQFHCQVEKAPVVRCTLDVQGKQFVERGLSKRSARFL